MQGWSQQPISQGTINPHVMYERGATLQSALPQQQPLAASLQARDAEQQSSMLLHLLRNHRSASSVQMADQTPEYSCSTPYGSGQLAATSALAEAAFAGRSSLVAFHLEEWLCLCVVEDAGRRLCLEC